MSGMLKNHHLAQAIADVGFYEFKRQMEYKGKWYGCTSHPGTPVLPIHETLFECGHVKAEMSLSHRVYNCAECGLTIDRDLNAAINLEQYATGSSPGSHACGESVSPVSWAVLAEAGTEYRSACG